MDNKIKNKVTAAIVGVIALCSSVAFSYKDELLSLANKWNSGNNSLSSSNANVNVHFLDVGQADSILIESDGEYMVIDGGNTDDEKTILDYLEKEKVDKLKYVCGTHPHEDHIGALDKVIDNYPVDNVFLPGVTHTSKTYRELLTSIKNKGLKITKPRVGDKYDLGKVSFVIVGPDENADYGTDYNNWSVIIKLIDGDVSYMLSGDAEKQAEKDAIDSKIDLKCDVYKVGHHGSSSSSSKAYLDALSPKYAIISVGKDNSYHHPHQTTLNKFKQRGIEYYRTDEKGTIVASSDGKEVNITTQK